MDVVVYCLMQNSNGEVDVVLCDAHWRLNAEYLSTVTIYLILKSLVA